MKINASKTPWGADSPFYQARHVVERVNLEVDTLKRTAAGRTQGGVTYPVPFIKDAYTSNWKIEAATQEKPDSFECFIRHKGWGSESDSDLSLRRYADGRQVYTMLREVRNGRGETTKSTAESVEIRPDSSYTYTYKDTRPTGKSELAEFKGLACLSAAGGLLGGIAGHALAGMTGGLCGMVIGAVAAYKASEYRADKLVQAKRDQYVGGGEFPNSPCPFDYGQALPTFPKPKLS